MPAFTQAELDELALHEADVQTPVESVEVSVEKVETSMAEDAEMETVENGTSTVSSDGDFLTPKSKSAKIKESKSASVEARANETCEQDISSHREHSPESEIDGDNDTSMPDIESKSEIEKAAAIEDDEDDDEPENQESEAVNDSDESASEAEGDDNEEEEEDDDQKSTTESEAGAQSEDDSDEEEDGDSSSTGTECVLCEQPIQDDEASAESLLKCASCRNSAHRSCAEEHNDGEIEADSDDWRCKNCAHGPRTSSPDESGLRKSTAPRLVRDLLPVSRGVQKPNSHSIFAQPLISEGEEGGRALRKRKSPTNEPVPAEKRTRRATPKALSNAMADDADAILHATRRASHKLVPTARILQHRPPHKAPPHKFILAFRLDQSKIEKILSKPPRPGKKRDRRRPPKIPPPPIFQAPVPKFPALPTSHLIFPSMWGDRENDINAKPYGGILSDQEADTTRSLPQLRDREIFEIARKEAEEERRKTSAAAEVEINGENANIVKPNRTVSGPPSKIKCIQFGKHVIDTFYAAPYPEEYSHESRLFICEFCLKYLPSEFVAYRHKLKCPAKHPPGDEIYRDGTISIWEVDGRKKTEYCQCLCLMAKMFLGSKTLYYDVEPFLFYILTEYDEFGYHFVGYFSKEKRPASQNNVSCILVMPIHQRKGYATFLIDFSYLLTRIEGKDGSPEKPLSDMGLTAYRSYWDLTIAKMLLEIGMNPFSTKDLMQKTGMTADDVIHSLERLYAFVRDPVTKTYAIRYDKQLYDNIVLEYESKKHRVLKPGNLVWTPYIMGRSDQAHLDGQPMQTVAPREGESIAIEKESVSTSQVEVDPEDAVSPKTVRDDIQHAAISETTEDPQLVNSAGHIAPGPPNTEALTGTSSNDVVSSEHQVNGVVNGVDNHLSGYALVYRAQNIPPSRFQIDPPIPAAMLRARLNRRKAPNRRTNGTTVESTAPGPVRSSPRHAASTNGSVGEPNSPEKPSTPVRRSVRKSGLANMEIASVDDSMDDNEQEDEIEAKPQEDEEEEEEEESSEDEDEEALETGSEEEDDEAEVPEDEDEEDDDDPEVEIDEEEEDDDEEDEEDD